MIETVHFSNNKPENSNIALTNKKKKFIKTFKDGKWQYCNKEEILDDLIQTNYCVDGFYEDSWEKCQIFMKTDIKNFKKNLMKMTLN